MALLTPPTLPTAPREYGAECKFWWMQQRCKDLLLDPNWPWIALVMRIRGACRIRPGCVSCILDTGWGLAAGAFGSPFGPRLDGTYALRRKGAPQFTEINIPSAALWQNQQVAEAISAGLNKGVKPDMVSL